MAVAAEPLTMPQISPTTSLQKLETRSELRARIKACLAPGTFLAARAFRGGKLAAAEAIPMTSKTIPIAIITRRTITDPNKASPWIKVWEIVLKKRDKKKVPNRVFLTQVERLLLLLAISHLKYVRVAAAQVNAAA